MKKILSTLVAAASTLFVAALLGAPAQAHGGGLDWQGGHNCYVASCAGTYHCHQPRGGICAASSKPPKSTKPKSSSESFSTCSALRREYPTGVAKWTETANAAVKYGAQRPEVSKSVFNANKRLDYDRDGVLCDVVR